MRATRAPDAMLRPALIVLAALAAGTVAVAALEGIGIPDASSAYLLSVVVVAVLCGTWPALATAIGAFVVYDVLFIEPRFTPTVDDPREWLNLLLLLIVGLVVGHLAGRERDRAENALALEREARALFRVSFTLAGAPDTRGALPDVLDIIRAETAVDRAWIVIGESVAADSGGSGPPPRPAVHAVLARRPGARPAEWTRVHTPSSPARPPEAISPRPARQDGTNGDVYRITIGPADQPLGAVWVLRPRGAGIPSAGDTRVLAAAADQIGGSLVRDRLRMDATTAEIARRSDALKSALLDSVSHDLRTPLAAIRAAAGTFMDPTVDLPPDEGRELGRVIDREATWLDRLVTNLLDMSRLEAGEIRPDPHVFSLADLIQSAIARVGLATGGGRLTVDIPDDLPPVRVDEVFFGQVMADLLDNAVKYAGPEAPLRVSARERIPGETVAIDVEDGGPGVPETHIERLFEKFYRVPRRDEGSRRGTGIGLAVVRGLVEAMGGTVAAGPSPLGGLAIRIEVPAAPPLDEDPPMPAPRDLP